MAADPYFTQMQPAELVRLYVDGADPSNPSASPPLADWPDFRRFVFMWVTTKCYWMTRHVLSTALWRQESMRDSMSGKEWYTASRGSVGRLSAFKQALQQIGSWNSPLCGLSEGDWLTSAIGG
jgi:hypothetical protein